MKLPGWPFKASNLMILFDLTRYLLFVESNHAPFAKNALLSSSLLSPVCFLGAGVADPFPAVVQEPDTRASVYVLSVLCLSGMSSWGQLTSGVNSKSSIATCPGSLYSVQDFT